MTTDPESSAKPQMPARHPLLRVFEQEDINFLLTNRIPRRLATRFIGWFSQIEQPWSATFRSRPGGCFPTSI